MEKIEISIDEIIKNYESAAEKKEDQVLQLPHRYISQISGELCDKHVKSVNYWLNVPKEKCEAILEILDICTNALILLDDVSDNSHYRKGIPTAHTIYGVGSTINSANYNLFRALDKVHQLGHPDAVKIFTEEVLEVHIGQGIESYWNDNFICPDESEYLLMTARKLGFYFMLPIRLMQLFSDNQKDFKKLSNIITNYFQLRDDYMDLIENVEELTEGGFSIPIIHAINADKDDKQILQILRQKPTDDVVKKYCLSLMEKFGSFEYTRKLLDQLLQQLKDECDIIGPNPFMDLVLEHSLSWKKLNTSSFYQR